jgi:hypothetical protein
MLGKVDQTPRPEARGDFHPTGANIAWSVSMLALTAIWTTGAALWSRHPGSLKLAGKVMCIAGISIAVPLWSFGCFECLKETRHTLAQL